MLTDAQIKLLLPLACWWAVKQEQIILRDGVPLSPAQIADARTIGVFHPEKVRLLKVPVIPLPLLPVLRVAVRFSRRIAPYPFGLSLRYGIFIRADHWDDRRLVFHELVHTMQYEKLGGVREFLKPYLTECIQTGYPNGAMEQEAVQTTARLCA
jgi:hypothetical protein